MTESRAPTVELPIEILITVLHYIQLLRPYQIRSHTLAACCLVSRAWYSAAIPLLYEAPKLTNRNFDHFIKTVCPPVNSHVRQVGVENFIKALDMGGLAYESTKSVTARLLRRTRASLELFVAPAVSFGVGSLVPLSKCARLRFLDLSHDSYDIDLYSLLHSLEHLTELVYLSAPRAAMQKLCPLKPLSPDGLSWPHKLSTLIINGSMSQDAAAVRELFASWLSELTTVAFENFSVRDPCWGLIHNNVSAGNVREVHLGFRQEREALPIVVPVKFFPNMTTLTVPLPSTKLAQQFIIEGHSLLVPPDTALYELRFRALEVTVARPASVTTSFLAACVSRIPKLRRIMVPETFLGLEDDSPDEFERLEQIMRRRVPPGNDDDSGIFPT